MNELKFGKHRKNDEQTYSSEIYQLRVDSIRPNRSQPRAVFDNNAIIRLADSIRRYGILQPLTVRPSDEDELYAIGFSVSNAKPMHADFTENAGCVRPTPETSTN